MTILKHRAQNKIIEFKDDNWILIQNENDIKIARVRFFQQLLSMKEELNWIQVEEILGNIPYLVSEEQNAKLMAPFLDAKIKHSLFLMAPNKALSPDDFSANFFQIYWYIIGQNITKAIQEFQMSWQILWAWNTNFLALIPKVEDSKEFK